MHRIDTNEPLWWGLFMAGAGVIGLLLPIHIFLLGLAIPLGWMPPEAYGWQRLASLLANPIVKLYLLALVSLTFFHWAHRFRYFLFDLGVRGGRAAVAWLCYGAAILGSIYGAVTVFRLM